MSFAADAGTEAGSGVVEPSPVELVVGLLSGGLVVRTGPDDGTDAVWFETVVALDGDVTVKMLSEDRLEAGAPEGRWEAALLRHEGEVRAHLRALERFPETTRRYRTRLTQAGLAGGVLASFGGGLGLLGVLERFWVGPTILGTGLAVVGAALRIGLRWILRRYMQRKAKGLLAAEDRAAIAAARERGELAAS